MATPFTIEMVTPESTVFSGMATQLSVVGTDGSLGILGGHAPLLTELATGDAVLTDLSGARKCFFVSGGFMEVSHNRVTILATQAISKE